VADNSELHFWLVRVEKLKIYYKSEHPNFISQLFNQSLAIFLKKLRSSGLNKRAGNM
jgi:hypothetical protein